MIPGAAMFKPTAFVLLAGLAVAQPSPSGVTPADVKRLAERLARLDPGASPKVTPEQLEAIKKMFESNPQLKKLLEQQVKDFQKLTPEQQKAKLDEYRAKTTDPAIKKQLDTVLPKANGRPAETPKAPKAAPTPKVDGTPPPEPRMDPSPPAIDTGGGMARPKPKGPNQPIDTSMRPPRTNSYQQPHPAESTPPLQAGGGTGYEKFIQMWEKNVGPLKDMPAVQQLAQELFKGRADTPAGGGPLDNLFDPKSADKLFKSLPEAGGSPGRWNLPDLGGALDSTGLSQPSFNPPAAPSVGGAGAVLGLLVLAGIVFAVLRLLPKLATAGGDPQPVPGLGPWPIDPRTVQTRADLVRAFEYLSVLLNGNPARAYSHEAAAAALREAVPAAADAAGPLADAYALARYTPADRPLSADEIEAARRHLCRLAGVPGA